MHHYLILISMHSSRMRTDRGSSYLGRGCTPPRQTPLLYHPSAHVHAGIHPSPRKQTSTSINITFASRSVIKEKQSIGLNKKDYENISSVSNFILRPRTGCEIMLGTSLYTRKTINRNSTKCWRFTDLDLEPWQKIWCARCVYHDLS